MQRSTLVPYALCLLAAACAQTPETADTLHPGAGESLALVVPAKGVQIYECRNGKAPGAYEWAFVAPDAELYDAGGRVIGRHGAGPYWQALDGSRVTGTVKAKLDAPDAGAVAWLLLGTRSTGPAGAFSGVTSIQRVNTVGGVAPSTPCTKDTAGTRARVQYAADYRFFTSGAEGK